MAKSLLFQPGQQLREPVDCGPGRQETVARIRKDGRIYSLTIRDKTVPEDPYLVQVKAAIFAMKTAEPYMGQATPRALRDVYIKSAVTI